MQSIKTITSKDLEAEFGRCITDIELAKYPRTAINKHIKENKIEKPR